MLSNIKKRNEGFTIIEVMIVLAIAGLIMLIVFLAVPALQRNSRNTQAKNAASAILATVNEFQNNNNGQNPLTSGGVVVDPDGTINVKGAGGTQPAAGKTQSGYSATTGTTFPAVGGKLGDFTVAIGYKCNGNTGFTASARSVAVGYLIEGGSTNVQQCIGG